MLLLNEAQVLFVSGNDAYVRDGGSALILRSTGLTLSANDVVNGFVYGRRADDNGMPLLVGVSGKSAQADLTIISDAMPAEPRHVTLAELTEADYCDLVTVEATHWTFDNGIYAVSGNRRVRLYNPFQIRNVSVPTDFDGKYFDVTAIFGTNTIRNVGVVEELKLLASPVEVEAPNGISAVTARQRGSATVYNLSGQRVSDGYRGLVVKDGRKVFVK